jgi:hypothetical protein
MGNAPPPVPHQRTPPAAGPPDGGVLRASLVDPDQLAVLFDRHAAITADIYSHVAPEQQREAADRLDDALDW